MTAAAAMGPDTAAIRAFLEPAHVELAGRMVAWTRREVLPRPEPADDAAGRREARELMTLLGKAGWFQPVLDQDFRACCLIREALAWASPLADAVFALQALGATPVQLAGSESVKDRWLPAVLRGQAMAAFAMTEVEAGSDVGGLATVATRDKSDYVLNGGKTLISNAGIADFYAVFATVDPAKGRKSITAFVVPAANPGLTFLRPQLLSTPHPLGEIALRDCRVPVESRLGEEGGGLRLGLATLDRLRPTVGAAACGLAWRALEEALAHASGRRQFGKSLAEFELIQEKLARMATDLAAARLLVYRAAWERDKGKERTTVEAAMAKAFATEAAQRIVDDAVQILGGRGVLMTHPVDRLYRAVRALRIYEGTTEIQHLSIAGELLKGPEGK